LKINLVPLKRLFLPAFFHYGIGFHDAVYRTTYYDEPESIEGPKIFATWHGRMVCFLKIKPRKKLNVLISKSNDGDIITHALQKLGFKVIRGSASRGGMLAIKGMLDVLTAGENVAFTVDGPRGPIYDVKLGIIKLAQTSGAPIIPVVPVTGTRIIFPTWDKFYGPLAFSHIKMHYGKPFYINTDASEAEQEQKRIELKEYMIQFTREAEKLSNTLTKDLLLN
jgi:hypothetical protein